jgi:hypothetical protein
MVTHVWIEILPSVDQMLYFVIHAILPSVVQMLYFVIDAIV